MHRLSAILLAALLSLTATGSFAGACESGVLTGAEAPVVSHLRSFPWTFNAPTRMALAGDSSLLVTDPERQRVITRDAAGRITGSHLLEGKPVSIAVDAQNRIYIGDGNLGRVRAYSRNWEFLYDLGIGAGEFLLPAAIAIDPVGGRIYVVDSQSHQVRIFQPDGNPLFSFGGLGDGSGQFRFPAGIFIDSPSSEVYVTDQLNFQVQIFDLQGNYLRCIGGTNASPGSFFGRSRPLNQPQGIWVDAAGRVMVSDAADGQIKLFDRNGNALARIGEFGAQPGGLRIPMDLVVDANNRLFVAAANNSRLEVFGLDDFQDPETVAPGVLAVKPGVLDRDALVERIAVAIELPGHRLDAITPGTLQVNGLAPISTTTGDVDRDLAPDLTGQFDAAALVQTLPMNGNGRLEASALLNNGLRLEAQAVVEVRSKIFDHDADGVEDTIDLCPDTPIGSPTDENGCNVVQACPCDNSSAAWRNRGRHLVCMVRAAFRIGKYNELPRAQLKTLIPRAALRQCGRWPKRHWGRR